MVKKRYTYNPLDDEDWDYPSLDDEEAIERYIEKRRVLFHKEWECLYEKRNNDDYEKQLYLEFINTIK